jgi:hypothetical protein
VLAVLLLDVDELPLDVDELPLDEEELPLDDEEAGASADDVLDFPSLDEDAGDVADFVDPASACLAFFLSSDG